MNILPLLGIVVRHGLTALGGALVAQGQLDPQDVETIAGAGAAAVGVGLSWWQKRKAAKAIKAAEAAKAAAQRAGAGFVRAIPFLLCALSVGGLGMLQTGCVSRPSVPGEPPPPPVAKEFLALAKPLAETFVVAMLDNNPRYRVVVCDVADGLGLAMQQAELTPEMVDQFTRSLREKHPELTPAAYSSVRTFIVALYDLWRARYGPVLPQDKQASEILLTLQNTLRNACDAFPTPPG